MAIAFKKTILVFGLSIFCFLTAFTFAQAVETNPKPSVVISLNKQTLRENDCALVQVWLINENNIPIDQALLNVSLPEHIKLSDKSCSDSGESTLNNSNISPDKTITENNVEAKTIKFPPLYIKSDSDIVIGDYNLFFYITYQWKEDNKTKQSIISAEKTIKVNFLGSDSIAGIPLGMAGFIVPGLIFWLVLSGFGVPCSETKELGNKLIYSVITSFVLIGIFSFINSAFPNRFPVSLDISNGISLFKLLSLALVGFFLGLFIGIGYRIIKLINKKIEDRRKIRYDDTDVEKIEKILRNESKYNPSYLRRRYWDFFTKSKPDYTTGKIVVVEDGKIYEGAMGRKDESLTTLVGWSKFNVGDQTLFDTLTKYENDNQFYELFNEAKNKNITIEESNKIIVKNTNGTESTNESFWVKTFESSKVQFEDGGKTRKKPITVEKIE